jgi:hypothetical protein
MTHPVSLLGAAALGIVLATSCADAQTVHHRAKHPAAAGRQIIVRQGVEPWLTLGTWAPVGSRQGYVLDTLSPPQAQRRPTKRQFRASAASIGCRTMCLSLKRTGR